MVKILLVLVSEIGMANAPPLASSGEVFLVGLGTLHDERWVQMVTRRRRGRNRLTRAESKTERARCDEDLQLEVASYIASPQTTSDLNSLHGRSTANEEKKRRKLF